MSSGRKASLRCRRRSSGQITLRATTPQATKLKTMLTKKQICARMTDPPTCRFYQFCNDLHMREEMKSTPSKTGAPQDRQTLAGFLNRHPTDIALPGFFGTVLIPSRLP